MIVVTQKLNVLGNAVIKVTGDIKKIEIKIEAAGNRTELETAEKLALILSCDGYVSCQSRNMSEIEGSCVYNAVVESTCGGFVRSWRGKTIAEFNESKLKSIDIDALREAVPRELIFNI